MDTGTRVVFVTTGSKDGFPNEWAHSGQTADIVRRLGTYEVDDEVGPMFELMFADGVTIDAFCEELTAA